MSSFPDLFCDDYDHPSSLPLLAYAPENVPGEGADTEDFNEAFSGCGCKGDDCNADPKVCSCLKEGAGHYDKGRLADLSLAAPIYECHQDCNCDPVRCGNR